MHVSPFSHSEADSYFYRFRDALISRGTWESERQFTTDPRFGIAAVRIRKLFTGASASLDDVFLNRRIWDGGASEDVAGMLFK